MTMHNNAKATPTGGHISSKLMIICAAMIISGGCSTTPLKLEPYRFDPLPDWVSTTKPGYAADCVPFNEKSGYDRLIKSAKIKAMAKEAEARNGAIITGNESYSTKEVTNKDIESEYKKTITSNTNATLYKIEVTRQETIVINGERKVCVAIKSS